MKFLAILLLAGTAFAQTVLMPIPRQCFPDSLASGKPLAAGKIFTYQAGTSVQQATFTDATGLVQNTNPVILDAAGCASIWLTSGQAYRFVAQNSNGAQEWVTDQVSGLATVGSAFNQAITTVSFSATPTFTATGQYQVFKMMLTGNVTSSTLSMTGVTTPSIVSFELTQDNTGGRTFVWPLNVSGAPSINLAANSVTTSSFLWDGTTAFPWSNAQSLSTTVAFSATPTFTATSQNQLFKLTLTGNVTSSTLNMSAVAFPSILTFEIIQDATGGRTFVWPTNTQVIGSQTISVIPSVGTVVQFIWDGTNAIEIGPPTVALSTSPGLNASLNVPTVIFKNVTPTTHTGDTTNDTIYSTTLPVLGPTSSIRVTVGAVSSVQGAGTTIITANLGATPIGQISVINGAGGSLTMLVTASNQNSQSVQTTTGLASQGTAFVTQGGNAAINTGVAQTLTLKVQNANSGDTQSIQQFIVELL